MSRIFKPIKIRLRYELARGYRHILNKLVNVRCIGVTGSCGKTTTTELIAAILAKQGPVRKSSHENTPDYIAKTILSVRPRHRFCVSELSGAAPGLIAKSVRLLQPQIGVVTNVGQDHYACYRNLESAAAEKAKLVELLPAGGTAVLNADDPYVFEMRNCTKASVITYGLSAKAMVRGENVFSIWPKAMSLDICFDGKRNHVETKLLGEHWAYAVLAAISAGLSAGVSLEQAIEAIEEFEPIPYRMCPHKTPDGVTFISDNWKGPMWTVPYSLDFMRKAQSVRKIAVIGSISDTPKSFFRRYQRIIRQTNGLLDKTIFAGEHALTALRAKKNPKDDSVMAFGTLYKLNLFLNDYLKPGDLVLLKGDENVDHLQRIVLSRTKPIACWRQNCGKKRFCDNCKLLPFPSCT